MNEPILTCADCEGELGMLRVTRSILRLGHVKEPHPLHAPRLAIAARNAGAPATELRWGPEGDSRSLTGTHDRRSAGSKSHAGHSSSDLFWAKVDRSGGPDACWPWIGQRSAKGYGLVKRSEQKRRAHRMSWEMSNGPISPGLCILHRCDNPPCVNPAHLFIGTDADNVADMIAKDRQGEPLRRRSYCKAGLHPMTGSNVCTRRADRLCRPCHNEHQRRTRVSRARVENRTPAVGSAGSAERLGRSITAGEAG